MATSARDNWRSMRYKSVRISPRHIFCLGIFIVLTTGIGRPRNPKHVRLGTTLYRAGRFAAAETEYRKLIELVPDYALARAYLAKTLLAEGKPEAALVMAEQEIPIIRPTPQPYQAFDWKQERTPPLTTRSAMSCCNLEACSF
jgi:tetratricopeptide (TPR) repeat protein